MNKGECKMSGPVFQTGHLACFRTRAQSAKPAPLAFAMDRRTMKRSQKERLETESGRIIRLRQASPVAEASASAKATADRMADKTAKADDSAVPFLCKVRLLLVARRRSGPARANGPRGRDVALRCPPTRAVPSSARRVHAHRLARRGQDCARKRTAQRTVPTSVWPGTFPPVSDGSIAVNCSKLP
jgi:hypothetical protein